MASLIAALAVEEYLNFRHAAASLGVSQSGVSHRIAQLEADLGIRLFERRYRGVSVTEAGHAFLHKIRAGMNLFDDAVKTAGEILAGQAGQLRVGLCVSLAGGLPAELFGAYHKRWPGVMLTFRDGQAGRLIRLVRADKLEVALVAGRPNLPDCHVRQLWCEPLMVALPENHVLARADRISWDDLLHLTFLVRSTGPGPQIRDHIIWRAMERGVKPDIRYQKVGRDTLLSMAVQEDAIALVSQSTVGLAVPGIVFRRVEDEQDPVRFSAVWSPHNHSPALLNLLELARKMQKPESQS